MSIADLVRVEYRMTALHLRSIGRIGLRYGLSEALVYDLNATLSWHYRYELKAVLLYGERRLVF